MFMRNKKKIIIAFVFLALVYCVAVEISFVKKVLTFCEIGGLSVEESLGIIEDWKCFPVPEDKSGKASVDYEDSFGGERTYGGKRRHEGTDLMSSNKERGYFPVVSVCDGIVEKKGWLKLGGWRMGIRSEHGTYFYYAHMERYEENLEEGSKVEAGQVIGYMGDSGYGEEGTTGQFAVHLHFGVYIKRGDKEVSINPYPLLKLYEDKRGEF